MGGFRNRKNISCQMPSVSGLLEMGATNPDGCQGVNLIEFMPKIYRYCMDMHFSKEKIWNIHQIFKIVLRNTMNPKFYRICFQLSFRAATKGVVLGSHGKCQGCLVLPSPRLQSGLEYWQDTQIPKIGLSSAQGSMCCVLIGRPHM